MFRYCNAAKECGVPDDVIKKELETYIHGIELEDNAYEALTPNLDSVAAQFGLIGISWDILHQDALTVQKYDGKMDFVVGNPPYVRVHNLNENYNSVKSFYFAEGGMTDIYLVFYELGLRMLKEGDKLCYITPSSWLSSLAGIKDKSSIKLNIVPKGSGLFSGLYILTNVPYEVLQEIIISNDFIKYISTLKHYKSGGYYTFNSKDLEYYLNYKSVNMQDFTPTIYQEKQNLIKTNQHKFRRRF